MNNRNEEQEKLYNPFKREKQYRLLFTTTRRPHEIPVFGCDNVALNYGRSFRGSWAEVNAEKERRCDAARNNREYPHWSFVELPQNKIVAPKTAQESAEELGLVPYRRKTA